MAALGAGLKREPLGAAGERQAAGAALGGSGMWGARAFLERVPRMLAGHRGAPASRLEGGSRVRLFEFSPPLPWRGWTPLPQGVLWEFGEVGWASV